MEGLQEAQWDEGVFALYLDYCRLHTSCTDAAWHLLWYEQEEQGSPASDGDSGLRSGNLDIFMRKKVEGREKDTNSRKEHGRNSVEQDRKRKEYGKRKCFTKSRLAPLVTQMETCIKQDETADDRKSLNVDKPIKSHTLDMKLWTTACS
ncbi:hypothetical protein BTVI_140112 [Pitangus sulphuratus]|nr:hypothetical protein BTVI_140112 [Pitangus sulphuratus]